MSAIAVVLIMDEKLTGFSKMVNTAMATENATLNSITPAHEALGLPAWQSAIENCVNSPNIKMIKSFVLDKSVFLSSILSK